MITWIQKTFQQHFRIIFFVLLVFIVISFVFTFNASNGFGRSEHAGAKRPFYGIDLTSEQDVSRLFADTSLSTFLTQGGRYQDNTQLQQAAFTRRALLVSADKLRIPNPTQAELKAQIQMLPLFMDQEGKFDAVRYNEFRQNPAIISQYIGYTITGDDVIRILNENARISAFAKLIAGPGYALPSDVQQILAQAETSWTLVTATISRESFKPTISLNEIELTQAFESNRLRYTLPARYRVSYAEIPAAAFANTATVTDEHVRSFYDSNPTRFPKPAAAPASIAAPAPTTPDEEFALVKPQVEAALRQALANRAANKIASDLSVRIYKEKISTSSPEFAQLLASSQATQKQMSDFSVNDIPAQFGANRAAIAKEVAALGADNRVSNAIDTGNGAIVLFWQETIPAREPQFAEVREKVAADYTDQQKQKRFVDLGQSMKAEIQAALTTGSTPEQAITKAAANANVVATTKTLSPFTLRQPPQDIEGFIYGALEKLDQGSLSNMAIVGGDGHFVYALNKKLPDLTEANPDYANYAAQLAQSNASNTAGTYARDLVESELAKSAPAP